MNTQHWRFNLNTFKLGAIAPMAIILVGTTTMPLSAQVVTIERRSVSVTYPTSIDNSIIYSSPLPAPVNSSIIYGSPIPSPSITYPSSYYSYPSYYPGSVTRVRNNILLPNPVLVNPTIRNSTLINPTIIQVQPQRPYRAIERNTTITRPINY